MLNPIQLPHPNFFLADAHMLWQTERDRDFEGDWTSELVSLFHLHYDFEVAAHRWTWKSIPSIMTSSWSRIRSVGLVFGPKHGRITRDCAQGPNNFPIFLVSHWVPFQHTFFACCLLNWMGFDIVGSCTQNTHYTPHVWPTHYTFLIYFLLFYFNPISF